MKRLIWVVLILAVAVIGGCDWNHEAKQRRIEAENDRRWEGAVIALAKKHNAVSDWEAKLPKRNGWGRLFSIEISRALIQSNGQPVLLVMELNDVREKGGSYDAQFRVPDFTNHNFQVFAVVKCSQEQADQLLHTGARIDASQPYAVVARLKEVSCPYFELSGTWDGDTMDTVLNPAPSVFIARGECVEVLRKGEGQSGN